MFLATLSIICKCGILGIGCVSIWCASGRGSTLGPKLPIERTAKTLIRLGGWAQKSFCWFCHEVAQNASSSSLHMQHVYISSHFLHFA